METFIPWTRVNRGVRREIITPLDTPQAFTVDAATERTMRKAAQSAPLIRALGLAHYWQRLLDEDRAQTIADTATLEKMDVTQARRLWSHCSPIPMWRSIWRGWCAGGCHWIGRCRGRLLPPTPN